MSELTGPAFGPDAVGRAMPTSRALPGRGRGDRPRIYVTGRVFEDEGRPVANAMVEVWQANAAGRYLHKADKHPAPPIRTSPAAGAA